MNRRSAALKRWGLAALYLAILFALLWLASPGLRLAFCALYLCGLVWHYWTWESGQGRTNMLRPLTEWDVAEIDTFRADLRRACRTVGLRREPYWAVDPSEQPTAYAVDGRHGMVAISLGLLQALPPDEVLAVVGHELKHLQTHDALPGLLGRVWLSLPLTLGSYLRRLSKAVADGPGLLLNVTAFVLEAPPRLANWAAEGVLAYRARGEEYLADLAGARVTSAPTMIRALEHLDAWDREHGKAKPDLEPWSPEWVTRQFHSHHPAHAARVRFLQAAAERGEI